MNVTIISHDTKTGIAVIKFEHKGVTVQNMYDLGMVIPSTRAVFADLGMAFTPEYQKAALEHLTDRVKRGIEDGSIRNPPEGEN